MIFRLRNGNLVVCDDNLLKMSEFLSSILLYTQPSCLLTDMLKKSEYRKYKTSFMKILEDCSSGNNLVKTSVSEDDIKQLSDWDSKLFVELRQKCKTHSDHEILEQMCEYIFKNVDTIFETLIHHVKFVRDEILLLVLEFLQISCSKRDEDMFDNWPYLIQGSQGSDLKFIVDPVFHPYIDFIRKIEPMNDVLELTKAAESLNIKPLQILIGCRLARFFVEHTEKTMRQMFEIPGKYREPLLEKCRSLQKEQNWSKYASNASSFNYIIGDDENNKKPYLELNISDKSDAEDEQEHATSFSDSNHKSNKKSRIVEISSHVDMDFE